MVLPTQVTLAGLGFVALAGVVFVVSGDGSGPERAELAASPMRVEPRQVIETRVEVPAFSRGDTYVEVYNNSGVRGLAGRVSRQVAGAGWKVVGSDNWYGTIPASTIYYPARLREQAMLLGADTGIERLKPAVAPMRLDRLTVILTGPLS